ncbi:hypothetical protein VHEMI02463 [[Torrubiella] hemipterigena]|uniref:Uncharacterized protein n=1 Tax=[Torrubiella] hemipterigena TaxID=1531966 RepID=A0A0A1T7Y1_9HYPO|nr:hypothetical protein VHEMI02463 [[Torrubiella] hemipterigena]
MNNENDEDDENDENDTDMALSDKESEAEQDEYIPAAKEPANPEPKNTANPAQRPRTRSAGRSRSSSRKPRSKTRPLRDQQAVSQEPDALRRVEISLPPPTNKSIPVKNMYLKTLPAAALKDAITVEATNEEESDSDSDDPDKLDEVEATSHDIIYVPKPKTAKITIAARPQRPPTRPAAPPPKAIKGKAKQLARVPQHSPPSSPPQRDRSPAKKNRLAHSNE